MAKIVDPDSLTYTLGAQTTEEVKITTASKTIQLLVAGNLSNTSPGTTSGVTLQAVYSKMKEIWKSDTTLNKYLFPIQMFTKTDGQFINGWDWADATTRTLVRDAGWTEISGDQYAGIISLGTFDATGDQAYYQHVTGFDQFGLDFDKTGNLNESILILDFGVDDFTTFLNAFLRIQGKNYSNYNLLTEQGLAALEPVLYRLPLSNTPDLNITATDVDIATTEPYEGAIYAGPFTETMAADATAPFDWIDAANSPFVATDVGNYITVTGATNQGRFKIIGYTGATTVTVDRAISAGSTTYNIARAFKEGTNGAVTAASAVFTDSTASNFVAGDVGRVIYIGDKTAIHEDAGAYFIVSYQSASQVTVDRNFDTTAGTITWYMPTGMQVNYLNVGPTSGLGYFGTWAITTAYPAGSVVKSATDNRWYWTSAGGTSGGDDTALATGSDTGITWVRYLGERKIGTNWYPFKVLVYGNGATTQEIYEFAQFQLRQPLNINEEQVLVQMSTGTFNGTVSNALLNFLGSTLQSKQGVFVDHFDSNFTNSIQFFDEPSSTSRTFPFVSAGNITFSANLVNDVDGDTLYTMYFTTNPAGNFDTDTAVIVNDNAGTPIQAQITGASAAFTFDYDNNVQGGRSGGTNADVTIVAQGLNGATWTSATGTITASTGLNFSVVASDERNYSNP